MGPIMVIRKEMIMGCHKKPPSTSNGSVREMSFWGVNDAPEKIDGRNKLNDDLC